MGHLIRRAESEMAYLHLSASTRWQYMQAWQELYTFLYLSRSTVFTRESCNAFVEDTTQKHLDGSLNEWKRKIRRRSVCVLLEVADTGCFQWKLFLSKKTCCSDDTLEALRQQYLTFLRTRNFEKKTIALYDYAFRSFIEGTGVTDVTPLLPTVHPAPYVWNSVPLIQWFAGCAEDCLTAKSPDNLSLWNLQLI